MSEHPILHAFPNRPIALVTDPAAQRRRRLALVGILLLFVPLIWFSAKTWQERTLRADLRERGVQAEVISAEGSCYARRTISGDQPKGCNLDIRYRAQGEDQERSASVYLPGRAPLVFAPPVLYDPEDPSRVMTQANVEGEQSIVNVAIPLAFFILIPAFALLAWLASGDRALRQAAAAPKPAIVPILRAARNPRNNRLEIWFERPADGKEGFAIFPTGTPLLVMPPPGSPPDRQWAAALLTPKGRPVLLDQELARLDLADGERAAILRAARGG